MLSHHSDDLFRTYATVFCRRDYFGMRAFREPFGEFGFFITRARYLLSEAQESHIEDLLSFMQPDERVAFPTAPLVVAGAWMAGLLKHRRFIPQLKELIRIGGNPYHAPAWQVAILLMDDPSLAKVYSDAIAGYKAKPQSSFATDFNQSRWMAIACLQLLDERHGTQYAKAYGESPVQLRDERQRLEYLLSASKAIRAHIQFDQPEELQAGLKQLLNDTTAPELVATGFLSPNSNATKPDFYEAERIDQLREQKQALVEKNHFYQSINATMPQDILAQYEPLLAAYRYDNRSIESDTDSLLLKQLTQLLSQADSDLSALWVPCRAANNAFDILSALDADIHKRLPADMVDYLYEKLGQLIPMSFQLLEQYAYDLLLRSNQYDDKARQLLAQAEQTKSRYQLGRMENREEYYYLKPEAQISTSSQSRLSQPA